MLLFMAHEYHSVEYYSQEFKKFLQTHLDKDYHIILLDMKDVEHHGNYVSAPFLKSSRIRIGFEPQLSSKKCNVSLDLRIQGTWNGPFKREIEILRSKTGRVSEKTYKNMMDTFVLQTLKQLS